MKIRAGVVAGGCGGSNGNWDRLMLQGPIPSPVKVLALCLKSCVIRCEGIVTTLVRVQLVSLCLTVWSEGSLVFGACVRTLLRVRTRPSLCISMTPVLKCWCVNRSVLRHTFDTVISML